MAKPLAEKHILIVEDDAVFRSVLTGYLVSLGATICEADNGKEGLAKMAQRPPDLIICDLNMPMMGGFEFVERLRLQDAITPVLVVSATNQLADIARILRLGVQDVLLKPIHDYSRLRESIMACLYPTMFASVADEVEQLMQDLDALNRTPGAALTLLAQLQPPVQQTLAQCRLNYRQLTAADKPGLVLDSAALSDDELAFYCLDVTQASNNHGVLAALLLRSLFNSLLQEHLVHQQQRLPELPVLLNQVNQLLRRANLQGRFPLLVGYYHRELKRLILMSAGLHATFTTQGQHVELNSGVPLGTMEAAYLNQLSESCGAWECLVWGQGGRLRLMLSTD